MSRPSLPRNQVLVGDVRQRLDGLPDNSVDTVISSPPYFQLRVYGVAGEIGLEDDIGAWVEQLRLVGKGISRVLKPTGSWWLNVGDSYSRHARAGAPAKGLLLAGERLAIALTEDGWILRNKLIWRKTNPMPASVRDRLSCTWEVVYFFVRAPRYAFDLDAIRIPHRSRPSRRATTVQSFYPPAKVAIPHWAGPLASGSNSGLSRLKAKGQAGHPLGKNPGDVIELATANFRGDHFATFPAKLVELPLLATCPEKVCAQCGEPWVRGPARTVGQLATRGELHRVCRCRAGVRAGLVLDPFFGAGTVGLVAEQHGRDWLGIELSPHFAQLANERIAAARTRRRAEKEHRRAA
jgi:site-specific DNA-methyltransferase (adenine-specific)